MTTEDQCMTDQELLELSAKVVGMDSYDGLSGMYCSDSSTDQWTEWNPLTDDGDALRLVVKLGMTLYAYAQRVRAYVDEYPVSIEVTFGDDRCANTRRAIVLCAAEIGKAMS